MDYKKDGFNPSVVKDRLFYLNPNSGEYEELLAKVYNDIVTGKIRIWYIWFAVKNLGWFYHVGGWCLQQRLWSYSMGTLQASH